MKKFIFLLFVSIAFFACSNDDISSDNEQTSKGLVFEIAAKTQLNTTRAGAPIYSQDASQSVTRVSVHAFKLNGSDYLFEKTYTITDWTEGTTFKQYEVPETENLPVGDYRFLAVGRDAVDEYQLTTLLETTTIEDVAASIVDSGDEYEIFAGTAQAQVSALEGTRVSLTMIRKVAGILGYFTNVPQILNGDTVRYLRLTASAGNKQVNLVSEAGSSPADSYHIINIDLNGQDVEDEVYTGNTPSTSGIVKLPNSQLSGAYMIPVDDITLTLGLYNEVGTALKTWEVFDNNSTSVNILANHFYSLGRKGKPDTTTGEDPDPGSPEDDDDAIDLLRDQTISITIDPAWNTVHELTIE